MGNTNNTIIVLGNGFDLNLNLPTAYKDFIGSSQFQELIHNGNKLCEHLESQYELQNWVDIEYELQRYSSMYASVDREPFRLEYNELCSKLCIYLNNIDYTKIDKNAFAYTTMCNLLKGGNITIVNFNYTKTIDYIIRDINLNIEEKRVNIYNIHGSAESNEIVFGVEDDARINIDDVFLCKATQKAFKPIDLNMMLMATPYIVILGHSIGPSDHHYFSNFFSMQALDGAKRKTIIITCYKEDGRLNIWKHIRKLTHSNPTKF